MQIILVSSQTDAANQPRIIGLKKAAERWRAVASTGTGEEAPLQAAEVLVRLRTDNRIVLNGAPPQSLDYIPSQETKKSLISETDSASLPAKIVKAHDKVVRRTAGAVFRLPIDGSDEVITAFITDWTPFPAACAVAVHFDHAVARSVEMRVGASHQFTGKFARHPLTGDLLPVFVASWVKPEFGTGAVIVNPAHSKADLDFARNIGLPVRFGLIENEVTGDPATWPVPPVIKSGTTTKTGRFDGLTVFEASTQYFEYLSRFGHACRFVDIGVGGMTLARVTNDGASATVFLNRASGEMTAVESGAAGFTALPLALSGLVNALTVPPSAVETSTIVVPAREIDSSLLFLRLAYADLWKAPLKCAGIVSVQDVQDTAASQGLTDQERRNTSMLAGPLDQPSALKQQVLEQYARFNKNHAEILRTHASTAGPGDSLSAGSRRTASRALEAIRNLQYSEAFTLVYGLQKEICANIQNADTSAVAAYYLLAYLLFEADVPEELDLSSVRATLQHQQ